MEKMMRTYASDEALVRILQRYLNDLRNTQPEIETDGTELDSTLRHKR